MVAFPTRVVVPVTVMDPAARFNVRVLLIVRLPRAGVVTSRVIVPLITTSSPAPGNPADQVAVDQFPVPVAVVVIPNTSVPVTKSNPTNHRKNEVEMGNKEFEGCRKFFISGFLELNSEGIG